MWGSFYSTQTQLANALSAETKITYNNTGLCFGCYVSNNTRINLTYQGVWKVAFSVQLDKDGGGINECNIWFKQNNVNIPNSNTRVVVAGQTGETAPYVELVVLANANDYIEVCFNSADTTLGAHFFAGDAVIPATPSVIVNVIRIA